MLCTCATNYKQMAATPTNLEQTNHIWTNEIETFFRSIADEMLIKQNHSSKCAFLWKLVSFLSIPLGVVSWIFGSAGFTSDSIKSSQSIVLLVIGACIVALERLKPKKYQQYHKTRAAGYEDLCKTILYEVSAHHILPDQLFHETLIKIRVLRLSAPDALDSNFGIFLNDKNSNTSAGLENNNNSIHKENNVVNLSMVDLNQLEQEVDSIKNVTSISKNKNADISIDIHS